MSFLVVGTWGSWLIWPVSFLPVLFYFSVAIFFFDFPLPAFFFLPGFLWLIFSHFFCSPVFLPIFYYFFWFDSLCFWQFCSQPGLTDFLPFIGMCFCRQMFVTDFEHFCLGFYCRFFVLPLFANFLPVFLSEFAFFLPFLVI